MNPKKKNLIEKLQIAIHALKTDSVHYNWSDASSCNCGIVAQCMLGLSRTDLRAKINIPFSSQILSDKIGVKITESSWKNAVKAHCPITGMPVEEIFSQLYESGLSKEDMCHLEYMNNPLILSRSGIETHQLKSGVFNSIFKVHEEIHFYTNKDNLIKYLSAWVEILKEGNGVSSIAGDSFGNKSVDQLRADEINAVAEQNFEEAARVRDRILTMSK